MSTQRSTHRRIRTALVGLGTFWFLCISDAFGDVSASSTPVIPLDLPRPDGTPGDMTKKAGWKNGAAPFGQLDDEVAIPDWAPRCRTPPKTLCEKEVFLMRRTFDLPPLKEGHRYRIRIDGSAHVNMGEGYAIYVNGKLLAESKNGIVAWRREGTKPRGSHVWADCRDLFKGGRTTVAVASFPMENRPAGSFIPHRAHLRVWMEEMRLPPVER